MPLDVDYDDKELRDVCERFHVVKLELFGSRARGEARPDSDIDVLVTFESNVDLGLHYFGLPIELERVFGVPVDMIERETVESDKNQFFKQQVFDRVETLYAA